MTRVEFEVIQRVSPPDWFGSGRGLRYYWPLAPSSEVMACQPGVISASLVVRHDPERKVYRAAVDQLIRFPGGGTIQRFHLDRVAGPEWSLSRPTPRFSHSGLLGFAGLALAEVIQLATAYEPHPGVVRVFTPDPGL